MFNLVTAGRALAQSAQPQTMAMEFPEVMSPMIIAAYEDESAQIAEFDCTLDDRSCLAEELIERFHVDQWARG